MRNLIRSVTIDDKEYEVPKWLQEMPKTDLHCHMGGSIRPGTLVELAKDYKIKLPTYDENEILEHIQFKHQENKSLENYLKLFDLTESVLRTPEAFYRVAYEIVEDAWNERVEIMELRFAPTNYLTHGLKMHQIIEPSLAGLKDAARNFGVITGLIICGHRNHPELIRRAAEAAALYRGRGVVGFDLAGQEKGTDHKNYKEDIEPVFDCWMPITIHAGEEGGVESIDKAVRHLRADRIGHGRALTQGDNIFDYLDEIRKPLEICISSNVDTGVVDTYDTHPVRQYFEYNLRLNINTDNRTVSDTSMTKEYMILMRHLGFSQAQVFKLAKWGFKNAFLRNKVIDHKLSIFDQYVKLLSGKCPQCNTQYNILESPALIEGFCDTCTVPGTNEKVALAVEEDPWQHIEDNTQEYALANFKW